MPVQVICKFHTVSIKTKQAILQTRSNTPFFITQGQVIPKKIAQSRWNSNSSKILWLSWLPASFEDDQKWRRYPLDNIFSIISLWEKILSLKAKYTTTSLYIIVWVQAYFIVSYPNRVISRVKCNSYKGKEVLNSHLESNPDPCYIQTHVIANCVIKRFKCNSKVNGLIRPKIKLGQHFPHYKSMEANLSSLKDK